MALTDPADHAAFKEPFELSIDVTENDIRQGRCGDPARCAIALAMKHAFTNRFIKRLSPHYVPGEKKVMTLANITTLEFHMLRPSGERWTLEAKSPAIAKDFIEAYDDATTPLPSPISFTAHFVPTLQE